MRNDQTEGIIVLSTSAYFAPRTGEKTLENVFPPPYTYLFGLRPQFMISERRFGPNLPPRTGEKHRGMVSLNLLDFCMAPKLLL